MSNNYFLRVKRGVSFAPQATAPATAKKGDLYFDNTLNLLQVYNGTTWDNVGGGGEILTIGAGLTGGSYDGTAPVTITFDSSDATFKITDSVDNTKEFKIDVAGNTGTSTTLLTSQTGNITLTLPNANDTLIGLATSDILTNKTISGTTNTLSNIGNASLTNSSITVNGSSISLGGSATITANTTNALTIGTGLSGTSFNGGAAVTIAIDSTVVTLTGTQTLTNKTIDDSLAFKKITTPSNPAVNYNKLYFKSNDLAYSLNSSGSEQSVGGWTMTNSTSLTASGTISISLVDRMQTFRIASSSGHISLSSTPFGSSAPIDGTCIRLIGTSDSNSVTITNNNSAKGCLLNGSCTLYNGNVIELQYSSSADRYYEISRNF